MNIPFKECPEGLFLFNGSLCFKSEYKTQNQSSGYWQSDAYVVSSGEYFWGGASTAEARDKLLVTPVPADHIDALTKKNERLRELLADMDKLIVWEAACPAFGRQFQERIEAELQGQDND